MMHGSRATRKERIGPSLSRRLLPPALLLVAALAAPAGGQQESVVSTLHNLSTSGPGEIRAVSETEVCKFCHIPHNAEVPTPLWSRPLSRAQYLTPELGAGRGARQTAPQPDGSSRLCLSCHDGTIALGEVAGEPGLIAMAGANRIGPGRPGYIGTDLSGSHPISFLVGAAEDTPSSGDVDMAIHSVAAILGDGEVRLDAEGKMQCNTCHDPHSDRHFVPDRVPHFWVKGSVDEVCLTCHALR